MISHEATKMARPAEGQSPLYAGSFAYKGTTERLRCDHAIFVASCEELGDGTGRVRLRTLAQHLGAMA